MDNYFFFRHSKIAIRIFLFVFIIAFSLLIPSIFHFFHLPVRFFLPMHWIILSISLIYGWRTGGLLGFIYPSISHIISGYPMTSILPSMTVELFLYGFMAGIIRDKFRKSMAISLIIAIFSGRIAFTLIAFVILNDNSEFIYYIKNVMVSGIPSAILQVFLIPFIVRWKQSTS